MTYVNWIVRVDYSNGAGGGFTDLMIVSSERMARNEFNKRKEPIKQLIKETHEIIEETS